MKSYPSTANPGVFPPPTRRLNLLVVEDHLDLHVALGSFLRLLGHEVRFAVSVASALRLAAAGTFDVLLSDIGLPDGDGWELRRRLAETGICPPLTIAMSGFGAGEHATRSAEAGYARHLVKPFSPEMLLEALDATVTVSTRAAGSVVKHQAGLKKQPAGSPANFANVVA